MDLISTLRQCLYELSEDSRAVRSGMANEAHSEEILNKYPELAELSTVQEAKKAYQECKDPEDREELRRAYHMALSFYTEAKIAGISDKRDAFYASKTAHVDGVDVSYFNLPLAIQKEPDYDKREAINEQRLAIVKEGTTFAQEMLDSTLDSLKNDLGYSSYIQYCSEKKGMDYSAFKQTLENTYMQLKDLYWKHMDAWVSESFGKHLGEVQKVHSSVLINLSRFDSHIKDIPFKDKVYGIFAEMGFPFEKHTNIHVDLEERDNKNPRACCYSTKVPEEIHLLVKPTQKLTDYETFLHETGHALHYGLTAPELSVPLKEFGTNYALSETYAFLMEKRMYEQGFLKHFFGFDDALADEIVYYHQLTNLWFLIRYIGKFLYEYAFFSQPSTPNNGSLYATTLTETTGFLYDSTSYLEDMDGEFYSADYLRAWIAERQLNHYLGEHYGKDWFKNPEASEFLTKLFAKGDSMECEAMIRDELHMTPFDTRFLIDSYKEALTLKSV